MKLSDCDNPQQRREELIKEKNISLDAIERAFVDDATKTHCENMIGAVSLPLGVAGPLDISGDHIRTSTFIPLATTEGALVASVNRGCKAINESGGADVFVYKSGATRGPVFYLPTLAKSKEFIDWIDQNKEVLKQTAESTSKHLVLKDIQESGTVNYVFLRISYDTGNAMGMNMVTIATQKIVDLIEKETGIQCLSIAGNYDIDKKPAWLNFIQTRGFAGWAEAIISKDVVERILKTTPKKIFDVWLAKCMIGSAMSGSLGFNSHYANIVAAFFLATGQDPAHIVEGSMGITTVNLDENERLHFAVYLPAIMIGSVGGGTVLKTQSEAIAITGAQNSDSLAEIVTAAVLAGELSLLSSLAEGSLAKVHTQLGR